MKLWLTEYFFVVMSKTNVFSIILIYALISSTLTIDKNVLYHVYILSVLYEKNYEIIYHIKTIIVLWKPLELNFAFTRKKKFSLIFI